MSNDRVKAVGEGYYSVPNLLRYKLCACRSCHASIIWAKTIHGNAVPLNLNHARKNKDGITELLTHFATCPNAKDWKKRGNHDRNPND